MTMVLAGPKRYRERIPDVWWLLVPGLEHQHRYRIQNQNTNTGSGSQTPGNWTLNSFLNYSWISPPVIHTFQNSSLVVPTFSLPLFWRLTVCAGYVFEVVLVSPCFETLLPFSSVIFMGHCDARGPSKLWIVQWSPCVSPTTHREASQQWTLHTIDPTSSTRGSCYRSECCPPSSLWYLSCCCLVLNTQNLIISSLIYLFFGQSQILQVNPEVSESGQFRKKMAGGIDFAIAGIRAARLGIACDLIRSHRRKSSSKSRVHHLVFVIDMKSEESNQRSLGDDRFLILPCKFWPCLIWSVQLYRFSKMWTIADMLHCSSSEETFAIVFL